MLNENDLELLSAYLDGALNEAERAGLEARLAAEPELRRELERLRATVALVKSLPTLTAPRDFTLSRQMARRPVVFTSAAFSALSAAAAVILLVIGAALFNLSEQGAAPVTNEVAFAPTAAVHQSQEQPSIASGALSDNLGGAPQATEESSNNAVSPTETPQTLLFAAQTTATSPPEAADEARQETALPQESQAVAGAAAPAAQSGVLQQAAPLAPLAAIATQPAPTATVKPSNTPAPTATRRPSDTPTPTATFTLTPTLTATPLPKAETSVAPETTAVLGIVMIVAAVLLFAAAAGSTLARRRS